MLGAKLEKGVRVVVMLALFLGSRFLFFFVLFLFSASLASLLESVID